MPRKMPLPAKKTDQTRIDGLFITLQGIKMHIQYVGTNYGRGPKKLAIVRKHNFLGLLTFLKNPLYGILHLCGWRNYDILYPGPFFSAPCVGKPRSVNHELMIDRILAMGQDEIGAMLDRHLYKHQRAASGIIAEYV